MDKLSEKEYLVKIEQHCRIELGKKRKKYDTQEGCAEEAERIEAELSSLKGEEREAVVKLRVNQGVFRNLLLEKYKHCCLCQVSNRGLLSASHIKPWSASTSEEKLDRNNGFLMCPNHDRLFDKGFISFKDDGSIMISEHLSETDRIFTNVRPNMSIELTEGNKRYGISIQMETVLFQAIIFGQEIIETMNIKTGLSEEITHGNHKNRFYARYAVPQDAVAGQAQTGS